MPPSRRILTRYLEFAPAAVMVIYAIIGAFGTYFCMYAFRKPFSVATYGGRAAFGSDLDLKTVFVISQIVGYCLSKYIGIKVCSEVRPHQRKWYLIGFILSAWASLLVFAVAPMPVKIAAIPEADRIRLTLGQRKAALREHLCDQLSVSMFAVNQGAVEVEERRIELKSLVAADVRTRRRIRVHLHRVLDRR